MTTFFLFESEDLKLGCPEKANNKNHTNLRNTQGTLSGLNSSKSPKVLQKNGPFWQKVFR